MAWRFSPSPEMDPNETHTHTSISTDVEICLWQMDHTTHKYHTPNTQIHIKLLCNREMVQLTSTRLWSLVTKIIVIRFTSTLTPFYFAIDTEIKIKQRTTRQRVRARATWTNGCSLVYTHQNKNQELLFRFQYNINENVLWNWKPKTTKFTSTFVAMLFIRLFYHSTCTAILFTHIEYTEVRSEQETRENDS